MQITGHIKRTLLAGSTLTAVAAMMMNGVANAATPAKTAAQDTRVQNIIAKGDQEIARRLTTLNTLTNKINAATKLSASDKAALSTEVSTTITGLNTLKAKLDAETTIDAARADAQDILTSYRVYALVVPKVALVKVADDQQVLETKLATLAQKLQTRLTTKKQAGKDTSGLQTKLDDLNAKVTAAQTISVNIETSVIGLEPNDYNSNHAILSDDNDQLKTARADLQTARSDAQSIVTGLKSL